MKTITNYFYCLVLFFLILSFFPVVVTAQVANDSLYQNSTIILPAISSSPETDLLLGGVGIYQFKLGDPELDTRPSAILVSGIYTLKNQVSFGLAPSLFLEEESWLIEGVYSYNYFPEVFWGIGSNTRDVDEKQMISRQIFITQTALRKIYPNLFLGPQIRWDKSYRIRFESPDGEHVAAPQIIGADDYSAMGFGVNLRWDKRNSMMFPTENHIVNLSLMVNPSWLGTLDTYSTLTIDGRKYHDFSHRGNSILAFQILSRFSNGEPPIKDQAILGGQNILRGYYAGRLRDRHGAQLQAEYRQKIAGRFGFSLFTAAGQVWNSFDFMGLDTTRVTAGGGLRINLNKKDTTNIRLDYGVGQNTTGFYIAIGEAF